MTDVLTVGALGSVLLTRWKMLVAFVVLGVGAGVAYGMLAPPTYTSKAVLFVIAAPAEKDGFYQAAQFAEKRAATYPSLLPAPEVVERTRNQLGLEQSASSLIPMLTATNPTDSSLVEVAATAGTPKLAQQLAGAVAQNLADYAVDLERSGTKSGAVTIKMAVPAREPQYPSSPSVMVLGALGGLAGGALGVVAALTANGWRRRPRGNATEATSPVTGAAPHDAAHPAHAAGSARDVAPDAASSGSPADSSGDADADPVAHPTSSHDTDPTDDASTARTADGQPGAPQSSSRPGRKRRRRRVRVPVGSQAAPDQESRATHPAGDPGAAQGDGPGSPDDAPAAGGPDDPSPYASPRPDGAGPRTVGSLPTNGQAVRGGPLVRGGTGLPAPRNGSAVVGPRASARGR